MSTALYLNQIDPHRRITILDRNSDDVDGVNPGNRASMAAAGMLAPSSERLPMGDYRDLCMASKRMYPDFVALVEGMAEESGDDGHKHLWKNDDGDSDHDLEPWNIGFVASGGFLAPAFAGDNVATWAPPDEGEKRKTAFWLDATQARELEPNLNPDIVGGWWFPEDTSVDARRLTCSLKAACVGAGVEFLCGSEVTSLDLQDGTCKGVWIGSRNSRYVSANAVLVANGAWMRNLLPVPLEPHKGQSLSLRMPADKPPLLRRVLFGGDSYIVPKADGRIVIGATVEAGSFDSNVTPAGMLHVLSHAVQLCPPLADLPIEETWAGLRPTTPDKAPILGETPWENLFLAGGYWRNGVLLAPKTGELLAKLIASNGDDGSLLSEDERSMLDAFQWDRFTSPEGGKKMAADSRYAASMYPVHNRKSGTGVAASVGTELGSYSTARSAGEERSRDRKSLFGGSSGEESSSEDLFEKAAMMGKEDADVFEGFGSNSETKNQATTGSKHPSSDGSEKLNFYYSKQEEALRGAQTRERKTSAAKPSPSIMEVVDSSPEDDDEGKQSSSTVPYDGSADAITVGSAAENNVDEVTPTAPLESIYESIRANKAKQEVDLPDQNIKDERPDPGFRISHVDKKTGEIREIPPYTQPAAFFETLEKEDKSQQEESQDNMPTREEVASELTGGKSYWARQIEELEKQEEEEENAAAASKDDSNTSSETTTASAAAEGSGSNNQNYDETTFDGYQEIFKANASNNRQDELNKMKEARMKNRSKTPPQDVRKKE